MYIYLLNIQFSPDFE